MIYQYLSICNTRCYVIVIKDAIILLIFNKNTVNYINHPFYYIHNEPANSDDCLCVISSLVVFVSD
jgi:hypothetical protein